MLWDIIRDFIVEHITGGTTTLGETYNVFIGNNPNTGDTTFVCFSVGLDADDLSQSAILGLDDWLATTITAVIMILLVVFAVWLVRWIFKAVSSAFLLK